MMPTITDWLMVVITLVYSITTIIILKANKQSVEAANAQLQESKRQFGEETRLGFMPWLQAENIAETDEIKRQHFSTIHDCNLQFGEYQKAKTLDLEQSFYFSIRNIGHDVAVRTEMHWEYKGIVRGCTNRGKSSIIGA